LHERIALCIITRPRFSAWNALSLMKLSLIPDTLRPIAEKIVASERISEQDALQLYQSNDLNALGIMASFVSEKRQRRYHSESLSTIRTSACSRASSALSPRRNVTRTPSKTPLTRLSPRFRKPGQRHHGSTWSGASSYPW
jgi:hypothetical protein